LEGVDTLWGEHRILRDLTVTDPADLAVLADTR
jgi:hypothetical protein